MEMSEEEETKMVILGDALQELGEHLAEKGDVKGLKLLKNVGTEIRGIFK